MSTITDLETALSTAPVGSARPNLFPENPGILPTQNELILPPGLSIEDWLAVGYRLKVLERAVQWWVGDWLCYGEREYGERYTQALDETDYTYNYLTDMKAVAERFPPPVRRDTLSWSHHREVAYLPSPADRETLLDKAEDERWTSKQLRIEVQHAKAAADPYSYVVPSPTRQESGVSGINLQADYDIRRKVREEWSRDEQDTFGACLYDIWYERAGSRELDGVDYLLSQEPGDYLLAFRKARKELGR